jgi:hypothetical protein
MPNVFDEEPNLPKNWPTCCNCAKTRGVDCSRKKDVGRGTCNSFVPKGALQA